ncbi:hypothetical protein HK096_006409, partial [Nowakowskiella sp. JEL0078]
INGTHIPNTSFTGSIAASAEEPSSPAGYLDTPPTRTRQKSVANSVSEYTWEEETISVEKKRFEATSSEAASEEELDEIKENVFESLGPATGIFSSSVTTIVEEVVVSEESDTAVTPLGLDATPVQKTVEQHVDEASIGVNDILDSSVITFTETSSEPVIVTSSSVTYSDVVEVSDDAEVPVPSVESFETSETVVEISGDVTNTTTATTTTTTTTTTTAYLVEVNEVEPTAAAVDIQTDEVETTQLIVQESIEVIPVIQETVVESIQDSIVETTIESIPVPVELNQESSFQSNVEYIVKSVIDESAVLESSIKSTVEPINEIAYKSIVESTVDSISETSIKPSVQEPLIETTEIFETSTYDIVAVTETTNEIIESFESTLDPVVEIHEIREVSDKDVKAQELDVLEKARVLKEKLVEEKRVAEEFEKKEAEELAKKEAEELAKKEAKELAKKEAEELAKKEAEEIAKKETEELAKKTQLESVKEEIEISSVTETFEVTNTYSQEEEIIEEESVSQADLLSLSNSYTETPPRTERGRSISSYAYERSSSTSSNRSRIRLPSIIPSSPMMRTSAGGAPLPLSAIAAPVRHVNPLLDEILYALELLQADDESLEYLDLKDCAIFTANHGSALAAALSKNTHLKSLVLTNTKLQTSIAIEIADALKSNSALQYLVLDHNLIGPAGIRALAEALRFNDTLLELRVAHQRQQFGTEAEQTLAESMRNNERLIKFGGQIRDAPSRNF